MHKPKSCPPGFATQAGLEQIHTHTHFFLSLIIWCIIQYVDVGTSNAYSADEIQ